MCARENDKINDKKDQYTYFLNQFVIEMEKFIERKVKIFDETIEVLS